MATKTFRLGAVLSITTGTLLCPMEDVYAILNHMTGDNLFTHQLPRAARECRPFLMRQFPGLPHGFDERVTTDNWSQWLYAAIQKHGDSFEVEQIPPQQHDRIDPLTEIASMVPAEKIGYPANPVERKPERP